jgi:hypothetical protein
MFPPRVPPQGGMPPPSPPSMQPGMQPPGLNLGPSPAMMQRMPMQAPPMVPPMMMAGNKPPQRGGKKKPDVPVNSPRGMTPAASIMQTGNAASNPYTSGPPMSGTPSPGMYGQGNPNAFWNVYNQNRPAMM